MSIEALELQRALEQYRAAEGTDREVAAYANLRAVVRKLAARRDQAVQP